MPEFLVRVHDPAHGAREVRVTAEHAGAVATALGLAPGQLLSVLPLEVRHGARLDLRRLAQDLSVLLQAGIPLLEALQTLREKDGSTAVLDSVMQALRDGLALSTALQQTGVDPLFVALVAASERNGQLAATLQQHAAYLSWAAALRARLMAALLYPALLLAAGGAVVLFLLLYVLPRFAGVFDGLGHDLPWASQALLSLGLATRDHPGVTLTTLALLLLALATVPLLARRSAAARGALAQALLRSPLLGPHLRLLTLARLYRSLALLLGAGIPVLQALRLVQQLLPPALQAALQTAAIQVGQGQRLSQALQAQQLLTPVALRMLRVGESSGETAAMLERAAAFHDEEISQFGDLVTRSLTPLLMLVMGSVIGGIVVLMYLPIFTMMEQLQ